MAMTLINLFKLPIIPLRYKGAGPSFVGNIVYSFSVIEPKDGLCVVSFANSRNFLILILSFIRVYKR